MSKWGWKHSAMFAITLMCAIGALVAAGLAETPAPDTAATIGGR